MLSVLNQEELDRRREEMMADAESHSRQREQRLRRLERDHRQEEKESSTTHSQDFLQYAVCVCVSARVCIRAWCVCVCVCMRVCVYNMHGISCRPLRLQSVAAAGSVQERIQQSIGSVQRTHAALDRHFLHK